MTNRRDGPPGVAGAELEGDTDVYRLAVQRECAGARHGNLAAIGAAYEVPAAALRRL